MSVTLQPISRPIRSRSDRFVKGPNGSVRAGKAIRFAGATSDREAGEPSSRFFVTPAMAGRGFHEAVEEFKRWLIEYTLIQTGGNRTEAAKRLGMNRTYLMKLIREFGISVPLAQPKADPDILAKKSDGDQDSAAASSSESRDQRLTPAPGSESNTL